MILKLISKPTIGEHSLTFKLIMEYQKYSGAGNKFIIFDNLDDGITNRSETVLGLFENGNNDEIDGVIFVEKSTLGDFWMNYYNRDGTGNSLCGNGLRCTVQFLLDNSLTDKHDLIIESIGKTFSCKVNDDGKITVTFPPPEIIRAGIKLKTALSDWSEDLPCSYINVGTPHIVIFIEDLGLDSLEDVKVNEWGRSIRMHKDLMPEGANVNFIKVTGDNEIAMRTYERGVERETLACGTGALSSAITVFAVKNIIPPIDILVRSGEHLTVGFGYDSNEIGALTLTGGAVRIS